MANIKLFENKRIRSVWNGEEQKWYFSVVDVIEALTDSDKPRDYWYRLKEREKESSGIELSTFCRQLKTLRREIGPATVRANYSEPDVGGSLGWGLADR